MEQASGDLSGEPAKFDSTGPSVAQGTSLGRWQSKRLKTLGLPDDGATQSEQALEAARACLLYTSDAADDM
eukprot:2743155-Alexandrium_andersonii.AAC.1